MYIHTDGNAFSSVWTSSGSNWWCTIDLSGLISHHLDPVSKSSNEALTWDFSSHRQLSHFYEIIAEMWLVQFSLIRFLLCFVPLLSHALSNPLHFSLQSRVSIYQYSLSWNTKYILVWEALLWGSHPFHCKCIIYLSKHALNDSCCIIKLHQPGRLLRISRISILSDNNKQSSVLLHNNITRCSGARLEIT